MFNKKENKNSISEKEFIENKKSEIHGNPTMVFYIDFDGTMNPRDKEFNNCIKEITEMGGMLVPVTGRGIADIENIFIENNIELPLFMAGDNGTVIKCNPPKDEIENQLSKKKIDKKSNSNIYETPFDRGKLNKALTYYLENGGNPDLVRATNKNKIFASKNSEDVRKYYKSNKTAKLYKDVVEEILETEDITKITLAGDPELMRKTSQYVRDELSLWTDADNTKFPKKEDDNWRLDITASNKGEAVRIINSILEPTLGYVCVGNGRNDIPMFRKASEDKMKIGVMKNSPEEVLEEARRLEQENGIKVFYIPKNENYANRYISKMLEFTKRKVSIAQNNQRTSFVPKVENVGIENIDFTNSGESQHSIEQKNEEEQNK